MATTIRDIARNAGVSIGTVSRVINGVSNVQPEIYERTLRAIRACNYHPRGGALSAVETDGALAYLIMCAQPGIQVMCVTYETNAMKPGDVVLFAGGYSRVGEKQVMLDPCLASRKPAVE